eukprot:scaffold2200_cov413-Prasinococcus_capsulatus_cf.AAC.21
MRDDHNTLVYALAHACALLGVSTAQRAADIPSPFACEQSQHPVPPRVGGKMPSAHQGFWSGQPGSFLRIVRTLA